MSSKEGKLLRLREEFAAAPNGSYDKMVAQGNLEEFERDNFSKDDLVHADALIAAKYVQRFLARLNHFDALPTACLFLCLHLAHFVTSISPKLNTGCIGPCFPVRTFTSS